MQIPDWLDVSKLGGEASLDLVLSPYSSTLKFSDLKIFRVGAGAFPLNLTSPFFISRSSASESMAPSSALPIGASRVITELEPTRVNPQEDGLLNALLALLPQPSSNPSAKDVVLSDEELLASDVSGFLLVYVKLSESRRAHRTFCDQHVHGYCQAKVHITLTRSGNARGQDRTDRFI